MRKKLKNPPLNELIIGVYFNPPLLDIYTHHVGIFWDKIRDRYPQIEQRDTLGNMFFESPNEVFPMPRFWLTSKDKSHLLQLQRNALLLNWRRGPNTAYPSFEPVKEEFDKIFSVFLNFVRSINPDTTVSIDRAELAYMNIVEPSEYWKSVSDVVTIIPSISPISMGVPETSLEAFNFSQTMNVEPRLSVNVTVRSGSKLPENVPILQFDIRAVGALDGATKVEVDEWFARAHLATGNVFHAVTSTEIRNLHWNQESDAN